MEIQDAASPHWLLLVLDKLHAPWTRHCHVNESELSKNQ